VPLTLATTLDAAAWARVREALHLAHGNQTAVARVLGLHRNRLRDAIVRLGLTAEAAAYDRATRQPRAT
jgi:ActR/RegA family two-component response regulator